MDISKNALFLRRVQDEFILLALCCIESIHSHRILGVISLLLLSRGWVTQRRHKLCKSDLNGHLEDNGAFLSTKHRPKGQWQRVKGSRKSRTRHAPLIAHGRLLDLFFVIYNSRGIATESKKIFGFACLRWQCKMQCILAC